LQLVGGQRINRIDVFALPGSVDGLGEKFKKAAHVLRQFIA